MKIDRGNSDSESDFPMTLAPAHHMFFFWNAV